MRQLHACDFCGADPTGVYEVLPDSLAPTEAEQRRVALCADCRDTLESVLTPLLARLDGSEPTQRSPEPEPDSVAEPTPEPTPEPDPVSESNTITDADDDVEADADPESTPTERDAVREEVRRTAPRADRPPGYAKVLRVLQNRDDAMARHDLEALATNAYGLDGTEFEAVIDAAVENGDLEESRAGLKTT